MRACRRFFELNPLGQLGLVVLREGIAEKLTDLSGSPEAQIEQLQQYGLDTGKKGGVLSTTAGQRTRRVLSEDLHPIDMHMVLQCLP